jgi:hypothetical protein
MMSNFTLVDETKKKPVGRLGHKSPFLFMGDFMVLFWEKLTIKIPQEYTNTAVFA